MKDQEPNTKSSFKFLYFRHLRYVIKVCTPISVFIILYYLGFPIPQIHWLRSKGKLNKDFYKIASNNNSLVIDYAKPTDEGFYICESSNGIGENLRKIFYLDVNEAVRFEKNVKNLTSRRYGSIKLECTAFGDEPITISWTHKNIKVDSSKYR